MKNRNVRLSTKEQLKRMRMWSDIRTLALISVVFLAWGYFGGVV